MDTTYVTGETAYTLFRDVARHLPGWEYLKPESPQRNLAVLEGGQGMVLWLSVEHGTRVHVTGRYPANGTWASPQAWGVLPSEQHAPEILLSVAKTPERLAREITQRFLPRYTALHAQCRDAQARQEALRQASRALVDGIFRSFPQHAVHAKGTHANGHCTLAQRTDGNPNATARVEHVRDDLFDLTLHNVSAAMARRVLACLA